MSITEESDRDAMPAPTIKFTKDTITGKGDHSQTFGFNCDRKTILGSKTEIWFWTYETLQPLLHGAHSTDSDSGCDKKQKLFEKLGCEWNLCPLRNDRLKEDVPGLLDKSNRIALVCVTSFFEEGGDFVFVVKGYQNLVSNPRHGLRSISDRLTLCFRETS
jgi:hypothetical protein